MCANPPPVRAAPAAVHEKVEQRAEEQRPGQEAQRMGTMPGQEEPADERERGGSQAEDHPARALMGPFMSVRHRKSLSSVGAAAGALHVGEPRATLRSFILTFKLAPLG